MYEQSKLMVLSAWTLFIALGIALGHKHIGHAPNIINELLTPKWREKESTPEVTPKRNHAYINS